MFFRDASLSDYVFATDSVTLDHHCQNRERQIDPHIINTLIPRQICTDYQLVFQTRLSRLKYPLVQFYVTKVIAVKPN